MALIFSAGHDLAKFTRLRSAIQAAIDCDGHPRTIPTFTVLYEDLASMKLNPSRITYSFEICSQPATLPLVSSSQGLSSLSAGSLAGSLKDLGDRACETLLTRVIPLSLIERLSSPETVDPGRSI
ncbi:uncharacterized protein RCC_06773 [Ramularia collo-cygni]|uniref:Uncharacterized protein n=1 Tax=Ramularia collo-cygni TaxID=112498 RepID=A0A2D3VJ48_9PEZI|nr:uncharacterized protein RCC_06773 [Ramularia collo-cygni]CZT20913.1 uncharacterized protein RCC_06773 [Ramularia collo-cygni]